MAMEAHVCQKIMRRKRKKREKKKRKKGEKKKKTKFFYDFLYDLDPRSACVPTAHVCQPYSKACSCRYKLTGSDLKDGKCSTDDGEQLHLGQLSSQVANWPQLANWIIGQNFGN